MVGLQACKGIWVFDRGYRENVSLAPLTLFNSIGAAHSNAPDEYAEWSSWTYETHMADLKELRENVSLAPLTARSSISSSASDPSRAAQLLR